MGDDITILDGFPYTWNSPSIVPANDTMLPVPVNPVGVDPVVTNEANVYVYVQNTGSTDFGTCACPTGNWAAPPPFGNPVAITTSSGVALTFTASGSSGSPGNLTDGSHTITFQFPGTTYAATAHAWALNGDKTLFALAATTTPNPAGATSVVWWIWITPVDGTAFMMNHGVNSITSDTIDSAFAAALFGWAGPSVVVNGPSTAAGGLKVTLAALPMASSAYPLAINGAPGVVGWICVVSPCGSAVAMAPQKTSASASPYPEFILALTADTSQGTFKQMGVPVAAGVMLGDGMNPTVTTVNHHGLGVQINLGSGAMGSNVNVDDPDCTFLGGGVLVRVIRVQSTTLLTAGMGVVPINNMPSAVGTLSIGQGAWVKVPVVGGWTSAGTGHWCLLAEAAYGTITFWNELGTYPLGDNNRAQRNIQIS